MRSGHLWRVLLLPSAACAFNAAGKTPVNHRFCFNGTVLRSNLHIMTSYPRWLVESIWPLVMWRTVCKTLYLVSPQMGNKGIYKCFRCVYHDLRLRSSRLLVRQAIVCVYHVNQYTPCPPKLCAFYSATLLLPFRPNSRHHVHFTSCTLKATRYIYIYVKCQEVSPHGSQQVVL